MDLSTKKLGGNLNSTDGHIIIVQHDVEILGNLDCRRVVGPAFTDRCRNSPSHRQSDLTELNKR